MEPYSVLMSVYYKENPVYFSEALDSMINQTFPPDEIVLVEDGPLSKELYDCIARYRGNYPDLFIIVQNDYNLGLGLSLAKGLKKCNNDYIARMDTDDISNLERCKLQVRYLETHPQVSVVGGQILEFDEITGKTFGKRILPLYDKDLKKYMVRRCPFNHMSVMFKKNDVLSVGNYRNYLYNEDYDLWIRLASSGIQFANIDEILVKVRAGNEFIKRRGGFTYFKSELLIQKDLYKNGIINLTEFLENILIRILVQIILPNGLRKIVYKFIMRSL